MQEQRKHKQALNILLDNSEFFLALLNHSLDLKNWLSARMGVAYELLTDMSRALDEQANIAKSLQGEAQTIEEFFSNRLKAYPGLAEIILHHQSDPVIEEWYEDHLQEKQIREKRLKKLHEDYLKVSAGKPYHLDLIDLERSENACIKKLKDNKWISLPRAGMDTFAQLMRDCLRGKQGQSPIQIGSSDFFKFLIDESKQLEDMGDIISGDLPELEQRQLRNINESISWDLTEEEKAELYESIIELKGIQILDDESKRKLLDLINNNLTTEITYQERVKLQNLVCIAFYGAITKEQEHKLLDLVDTSYIRQKFHKFLKNQLMGNQSLEADLELQLKHLENFYTQDILHIGYNTLMIDKDYLLEKPTWTTSIVNENGHIYLTTKITNLTYSHYENSDMKRHIPGTLEVRHKVTSEGIKLDSISASNHLLHQCVMQKKVELTDELIMQAKNEEVLNMHLYTTQNHSRTLTGRGCLRDAVVAARVAHDVLHESKALHLNEKKTIEKISEFQQRAKSSLETADKVLTHHRSWKGKFLEILSAVSVIGLFMMGIKKALTKSMATSGYSLFPPESKTKLVKIENSVEEITENLSKAAMIS